MELFLRSCDAFGIDGVILPKNRSVAITEVVAHVSTGAIEFVPICYVNSLTNTIRLLKENNFWIVGTDASGDASFADIDKKLNLAIIIGSEGFGMSKSILKDVDYLLSIPMIGHVNSLNASVSAGIVLHNLM
ncbi:MAG: RNA methyltransferase [Clostridium sp.]|nr:MAG: RNA methyltransferase [Clostridium sp.]